MGRGRSLAGHWDAGALEKTVVLDRERLEREMKALLRTRGERAGAEMSPHDLTRHGPGDRYPRRRGQDSS